MRVGDAGTRRTGRRLARMSSTPLPRYPGMRQPESIIWDTWKAAVGIRFDDVQYNVAVGEGITPNPLHSAAVQAMAIKNSQRKVDVVYRVGTERTIVEVKERAQFGSIGQLLGYQHIWMQDHPGEPAPRMLLLTNRLSPGVQSAAVRYGITVVVQPADFGGLQGRV